MAKTLNFMRGNILEGRGKMESISRLKFHRLNGVVITITCSSRINTSFPSARQYPQPNTTKPLFPPPKTWNQAHPTPHHQSYHKSLLPKVRPFQSSMEQNRSFKTPKTKSERKLKLQKSTNYSMNHELKSNIVSNEINKIKVTKYKKTISMHK